MRRCEANKLNLSYLNLQEKFFITEKTLKADLDELGGALIVPAEQVNSRELRVTEMNSDHVTVEIKVILNKKI